MNVLVEVYYNFLELNKQQSWHEKSTEQPYMFFTYRQCINLRNEKKNLIPVLKPFRPVFSCTLCCKAILLEIKCHHIPMFRSINGLNYD